MASSGAVGAGHQLHLPGGLVQQHRRPADDGAGAGRGQPGGPRVVDDVEHHRDLAACTATASAAPGGSVLISRSQPATTSGEKPPPTGARPGRAAAASVSTGSERTTSVGERSPSCTSRGQRGPGGGATAEHDRASRRRHPRLGQRGDDAVHVGVVAPQSAVAEQDGVGGGHVARQVGDLVQQREHRLLERHGERQPPPLPPEPAQEAGQPVDVHLDGVVGPGQAERGVGSAVQQRRQRVADRRAEDSRPQKMPSALAFATARLWSCRLVVKTERPSLVPRT
jgi:hypothetical protein